MFKSKIRDILLRFTINNNIKIKNTFISFGTPKN